MEKQIVWDELQQKVAEIPRSHEHYSTNLFVSREQIEKWCASAPLTCLQAEGAFLLLRVDEEFRHVYHVARDMTALTTVLRRLPPGSYGSDLVGEGKALDQICDAYVAAGFTNYSFLCRMGRTESEYLKGEHSVEVAVPNDAPEVRAFLNPLLDRFIEEKPGIDELAEAAAKGNLLVVRADDGAIVGMLMYDVRGQLAHLRFWHVDRSSLNLGIGRRLMEAFLSRCAQMQRILLWVIGDNSRSISIYRHYGFVQDGLIDRIMVMHKDNAT